MLLRPRRETMEQLFFGNSADFREQSRGRFRLLHWDPRSSWFWCALFNRWEQLGCKRLAECRSHRIRVCYIYLHLLGGGFKHLLFSSLPGEMIQFDQYFSNGLKPSTYIYHKNQPNVGKYTIHGSYGDGVCFGKHWATFVLTIQTPPRLGALSAAGSSDSQDSWCRVASGEKERGARSDEDSIRNRQSWYFSDVVGFGLNKTSLTSWTECVRDFNFKQDQHSIAHPKYPQFGFSLQPWSAQLATRKEHGSHASFWAFRKV